MSSRFADDSFEWAFDLGFTKHVFLELPIWYFENIQPSFLFMAAIGINMAAIYQRCQKRVGHGGGRSWSLIGYEIKGILSSFSE